MPSLSEELSAASDPSMGILVLFVQKRQKNPVFGVLARMAKKAKKGVPSDQKVVEVPV